MICKNCGSPIDDKAVICVHCGAQVKKKKKPIYQRVWFWILAILVVVIVAASIGGGNDDGVKKPSDVQGDSSITAPKEDGTTAPTADDDEDQPPTPQEVTIQETVLYQAHDITITATGMKDSLFGQEVTLQIVNDSAKNVTVSSRDLSVNGYMMDTTGFYAQVAAGKKAIDDLTLYSSELNEAGIETVATIEFSVHVSDSDSFDNIDDSDLVCLSTSAADGFVQPVDDSGDVVYDDHGIRVICKGLKENVIWDGAVVFLIENTSKEFVTVHAENLSVNGYMVSEALWSQLRPNTRSVEAMYLLTLDEIGLDSTDEVEDIEFTLRLIDNDWNEIDTTDTLRLEFN